MAVNNPILSIADSYLIEIENDIAKSESKLHEIFCGVNAFL